MTTLEMKLSSTASIQLYNSDQTQTDLLKWPLQNNTKVNTCIIVHQTPESHSPRRGQSNPASEMVGCCQMRLFSIPVNKKLLSNIQITPGNWLKSHWMRSSRTHSYKDIHCICKLSGIIQSPLVLSCQRIHYKVLNCTKITCHFLYIHKQW